MLPPKTELVPYEDTNHRTQRSAGMGGQKAVQAGALRTGTLTNPDEERRAAADCCGHAACRHATMRL